MSELIVKFHHDERGIARSWEETGKIIRCRDCKHHDGIRCFRWNSTIITGFDDYCSKAERRGEEE